MFCRNLHVNLTRWFRREIAAVLRSRVDFRDFLHDVIIPSLPCALFYKYFITI